MPLTSDDVHVACGPSGSIEATEAMIKKHGAPAVAAWRDKNGRTALHCALYWRRNVNVLSALIRAGVDVTVASNLRNTALHCAETAEQVRVLTDAGASLSACNSLGYTPLYEACCFGRVEVVRAMLEKSSAIPRVIFAKTKHGKMARNLVSCFDQTVLGTLLDNAMREAEVWSRRSSTLLIGLAAADVVKAVAVAAGKTWAL